MAVFVIDRRQAPLMPCSEKRARLLLARGRARVHRLIPFTIRLIDRAVAQSELQPLELKIDPGSKTSGLALVRNRDTVNATRWKLLNALKATGLPVRTGSGGLTKCNRSRLAIPKTHALDAVCVGQVDHVEQWQTPTLVIKATGRGSYQRTRLNRFGFPRGYLTRQKRIHGFQTGDRVKAIVTKGKKVGTYMGRVAVRASGSFNIQSAEGGLVQGISHRYCTLIQRSDGYGYSLRSDSY